MNHAFNAATGKSSVAGCSPARTAPHNQTRNRPGGVSKASQKTSMLQPSATVRTCGRDQEARRTLDGTREVATGESATGQVSQRIEIGRAALLECVDERPKGACHLCHRIPGHVEHQTIVAQSCFP